MWGHGEDPQHFLQTAGEENGQASPLPIPTDFPPQSPGHTLKGGSLGGVWALGRATAVLSLVFCSEALDHEHLLPTLRDHLEVPTGLDALCPLVPDYLTSLSRHLQLQTDILSNYHLPSLRGWR
jgi:hypothetical protein